MSDSTHEGSSNNELNVKVGKLEQRLDDGDQTLRDYTRRIEELERSKLTSAFTQKLIESNERAINELMSAVVDGTKKAADQMAKLQTEKCSVEHDRINNCLSKLQNIADAKLFDRITEIEKQNENKRTFRRIITWIITAQITIIMGTLLFFNRLVRLLNDIKEYFSQ